MDLDGVWIAVLSAVVDDERDDIGARHVRHECRGYRRRAGKRRIARGGPGADGPQVGQWIVVRIGRAVAVELHGIAGVDALIAAGVGRGPAVGRDGLIPKVVEYRDLPVGVQRLGDDDAPDVDVRLQPDEGSLVGRGRRHGHAADLDERIIVGRHRVSRVRAGEDTDAVDGRREIDLQARQTDEIVQASRPGRRRPDAVVAINRPVDVAPQLAARKRRVGDPVERDRRVLASEVGTERLDVLGPREAVETERRGRGGDRGERQARRVVLGRINAPVAVDGRERSGTGGELEHAELRAFGGREGALERHAQRAAEAAGGVRDDGVTAAVLTEPQLQRSRGRQFDAGERNGPAGARLGKGSGVGQRGGAAAVRNLEIALNLEPSAGAVRDARTVEKRQRRLVPDQCSVVRDAPVQQATLARCADGELGPCSHERRPRPTHEPACPEGCPTQSEIAGPGQRAA